jgi:adenosylcobyric acid synthase
VRLTVEPAELDDADLVVLPGSKSTVGDLDWLRESGLAAAVERHAACGKPVLGLCGGFQMLAASILDDVESRRGHVAGLGLAPVRVVFGPTKTLGRPHGTSVFGPVSGYEIHYRQIGWRADGVEPLIRTTDGAFEGVAHANIFGTHWHGAFESDEFRRRFLTEAARLAGRTGFQVAPDTSFGAAREAMLDLLGDLVEAHLDTDALWRLIEDGAARGLPVLAPGGG